MAVNSLEGLEPKARSEQLVSRAATLKKNSTALLENAYRLRDRCLALLGRSHSHSCMGCKKLWKCRQCFCELKFLCLCLQCHKRFGEVL